MPDFTPCSAEHTLGPLGIPRRCVRDEGHTINWAVPTGAYWGDGRAFRLAMPVEHVDRNGRVWRDQ